MASECTGRLPYLCKNKKNDTITYAIERQLSLFMIRDKATRNSMGLHYTFETIIDQLETWFPKPVYSLRFLDSP
ncbi:hypothetical protein LR48_Vigan02g146700 [Vigna angularis]|uniref:Uncharacterized protein n=1 Tax=Phaseolus angularis TaxID=3914 RepID=A0A0L9TY29_PHAAN|nr:hypothetical protein LR48_Vigan02g146700 [Vigna angularis]